MEVTQSLVGRETVGIAKATLLQDLGARASQLLIKARNAGAANGLSDIRIAADECKVSS